MVEAKTRVEIEPEIIKGNPFYGNINKISVLEDIAKYDKDARDIIAPCGVFAVFKVRDNTKISIKVSRYMLEHVDGGCFYTTFMSNFNAYELNVEFDKHNKIKSVSLSEWLDINTFQECEDADAIYDESNYSLISCEEYHQ